MKKFHLKAATGILFLLLVFSLTKAQESEDQEFDTAATDIKVLEFFSPDFKKVSGSKSVLTYGITLGFEVVAFGENEDETDEAVNVSTECVIYNSKNKAVLSIPAVSHEEQLVSLEESNIDDSGEHASAEEYEDGDIEKNFEYSIPVKKSLTRIKALLRKKGSYVECEVSVPAQWNRKGEPVVDPDPSNNTLRVQFRPVNGSYKVTEL